MVRYESRILNALLDSYENSLLSRGENKIAVHICIPFTKKIMPEYFDESSLVYEDIHGCMKELEQKGYVKILWKKGKENHIIEKIQLNSRYVQDVYTYLKRTPKEKHEEENLQILEQMKERYPTPVTGRFISYLIERIVDGKTVKEYIKLEDVERTENLIKILAAIENNKEECYIREFSIKHLADTKYFESMLGVIGKVMSRFNEGFADMDIYAILAEYSIYHTPNYIYFKGTGRLTFKKASHIGIDLRFLKQGIGLAGEDLQSVEIEEESDIKKIITIENLTTFFRWEEEHSLIIYLGGYHNSARRKLLRMFYEKLPDMEYFHFGDIDVGGFEIYEDLCRKTEIPFQLYYMGIKELRKYKQYAKPLTKNDRMRLRNLMDKNEETDCKYLKVLEYMWEHGIKLEQECIRSK